MKSSFLIMLRQPYNHSNLPFRHHQCSLLITVVQRDLTVELYKHLFPLFRPRQIFILMMSLGLTMETGMEDTGEKIGIRGLLLSFDLNLDQVIRDKMMRTL